MAQHGSASTAAPLTKNASELRNTSLSALDVLPCALNCSQGDGKGDYCPSILLLHGSQHWHPGSGAAAAAAAAAGGGVAAGGTPAANGTSTTAAQQGDGSGDVPAPCGSGGNRVFARESYPDGLPCSLWVMLRTEAAGGSSDASSAGSGSLPASSRAAVGAAAGDGAAMLAVRAAGQQARVVPWSRPDELAGLLARELQLQLD